jgi:N-acetylmuramoyl-L-alanine amidase
LGSSRESLRLAALAAALALAGACAPSRPVTAPAPAVGLPPVPRATGPLALRSVYPTPQTPLPRVDSSFVYGSVGSGAARLTINGAPVEVAPNGAFIAFVPVPASGTYSLVAETGGQVETGSVTYKMPPPPSPAPAAPAAPTIPAPAPPSTTGDYAAPRAATVTGPDTLATGSDVVIGRPSPTGTYRWFLPRGARLHVTGRRGDQYRVRLDSATTAWFPVKSLRVADSTAAPPAAASVGAVTLRPAEQWVDVRVAAGGAPFLVEGADSAVDLTVYAAGTPAAPSGSDPWISGAAWSAPTPGAARLRLSLARPLWGYKAFYEPDGTLVVRLRRPPTLDPSDPLRGLRIVIDPGHPPAGATGPTGMREAEANLAVGLELARQLQARGAAVTLTRSDSTAVPLEDRVNLAVRTDAQLLLSIHNNAFAEGMNPFRTNGTSTYYFHPFSAPLARALDREIASVTRITDLGAKRENLALVRPSWMPSTLTESLYMPIPEQEAALKDPGFVHRLAAAHVRGIEDFLRTLGTTP